MRNTILTIILSILSLPLMAWGPKGHRIIAEVAYSHLCKKTISQVDALLGKHGMINWVNWADEIKSDTIYPYSFTWHFQDLDAGMSDEAVAATLINYPKEGGEMWRALDSLKAELQKDKRNIDALKFFIHITGDTYCPMHVAHIDDRGGNSVKMKWFGTPTNLHRVWDENMIDSRGFSYTEYAKFLCDKYDVKGKGRSLQSRADDLVKTYHLTCAVYDWQAAGDTNTYHYIYRFKEEMEWQLYVAGLRLADELNGLYAK